MPSTNANHVWRKIRGLTLNVHFKQFIADIVLKNCKRFFVYRRHLRYKRRGGFQNLNFLPSGVGGRVREKMFIRCALSKIIRNVNTNFKFNNFQ